MERKRLPQAIPDPNVHDFDKCQMSNFRGPSDPSIDNYPISKITLKPDILVFGLGETHRSLIRSSSLILTKKVKKAIGIRTVGITDAQGS